MRHSESVDRPSPSDYTRTRDSPFSRALFPLRLALLQPPTADRKSEEPTRRSYRNEKNKDIVGITKRKKPQRTAGRITKKQRPINRRKKRMIAPERISGTRITASVCMHKCIRVSHDGGETLCTYVHILDEQTRMKENGEGAKEERGGLEGGRVG